MFCPECGHFNETVSRFCSECAGPMPQKFAKVAEAAPANTLNDEDYYRAIIGPGSTDYYLERFRLFDQQYGVSATWHWPSLFVFFYWLLYRKMWLYAVLYFVAQLISGFVLGLISGLLPFVGILLNLALFFALLLGPPMYANALYYRHCQKLIADATAYSSNPNYQLTALRDKGGTSLVALLVALGIFGLGVLGTMAAIAIPAYKDYTVRAHLAQSLMVGQQAGQAVSTYYARNQTLPDNLAQAGFSAPLPTSVSMIDYNPNNGDIRLLIQHAPINGQALILESAVDANGSVTWQCRSDEIDARYLPKECRSE